MDYRVAIIVLPVAIDAHPDLVENNLFFEFRELLVLHLAYNLAKQLKVSSAVFFQIILMSLNT